MPEQLETGDHHRRRRGDDQQAYRGGNARGRQQLQRTRHPMRFVGVAT